EIRLYRLGSAKSQFLVSAVHGVTRLEGYDSTPSHARELRPELSGRQPQILEIVPCGLLQTFHRPANVPGVALVQRVVDAGVNRAGGTENSLNFRFAVRLPHFFDVQNREHYSLWIAKGDFTGTRLQRSGKLLRYIEGDRNWPNQTTRQVHGITDTLEICASHESTQRGKSAVHQEFQITNLAPSQVP